MRSPAELRRQHVVSAQRVVVKVGTNVLAAPGRPLDDDRVCGIAEQIARLVETGRQVSLVSSGAIGCGMSELGIAARPTTLPLLQAAASVGQGKLVAHYERHFRRHGLHAAQILLTREDFDDRQRYLNASNTLHALLDFPCVPVINENDTISTDEIKFGDNDRLAALVTHLVRAELLVLLTSVPGLYAEKPGPDGEGRVLDVVESVDEDVQQLVYDETTPDGLGGMDSKLEAARVAVEAGEAAVIADGRDPEILDKLVAGQTVGTLFVPGAERLSSYKRWLRFTSRPRGSLRVDEGARRALVERGKSLLPIGVTEVDGEFELGDVVRILGPQGAEVARGLANYSADEMRRIKGCQSSEIEAILGHRDYDEVVHRDNLALVN
ncbi:MAG: glutamate 5-kinase [Candidatus Brocadiia bacterium]